MKKVISCKTLTQKLKTHHNRYINLNIETQEYQRCTATQSSKAYNYLEIYYKGMKWIKDWVKKLEKYIFERSMGTKQTKKNGWIKENNKRF